MTNQLIGETTLKTLVFSNICSLVRQNVFEAVDLATTFGFFLMLVVGLWRQAALSEDGKSPVESTKRD